MTLKPPPGAVWFPWEEEEAADGAQEADDPPDEGAVGAIRFPGPADGSAVSFNCRDASREHEDQHDQIRDTAVNPPWWVSWG